MDLWLLIIGMGVITYALRLTLIAALGRVELSSLLQGGLKFVPVAVLSAIVFPELLRPQGRIDFSLGNERLIAGLVAIVVAWYTKNVLLTIGTGMVVLWFLQVLLSGTGS